jgi:hypothetical protein
MRLLRSAGVLHGDKIDRIFVAAMNVTLFDRDVLGLVDLDRLCA